MSGQLTPVLQFALGSLSRFQKRYCSNENCPCCLSRGEGVEPRGPSPGLGPTLTQFRVESNATGGHVALSYKKSVCKLSWSPHCGSHLQFNLRAFCFCSPSGPFTPQCKFGMFKTKAVSSIGTEAVIYLPMYIPRILFYSYL